ncbi:ribosomal protein L35, putative [Plasmodium malariae]|uniref:50S ribosomal protein L35 n=2 Tax=Plasmodium malariae TaxID=5858 RepID=A0A1C3KBB5_PLAMA|nr:ribosomal protein L35, putative [Plasmodium malariae]
MKCSFIQIVLLILSLHLSHCKKQSSNTNKSVLNIYDMFRQNMKEKKYGKMYFLANNYDKKYKSRKKKEEYKTVFFKYNTNNSNSNTNDGNSKNNNMLTNWDSSFTLYVRGCTNLKPKTNKSIAKRFKLTKNGKLIRKKAGASHMLRKKTSSNRASLRKRTTIASGRIAKKYKSVIFK